MSTQKKKKLSKFYWFALFLVTLFIGITLPIYQNTPVESAALYTVLALIGEGIAYYGQTRPSIKLDRLMYILMGLCIGLALWLIIIQFVWRNDVLFLFSLIVCSVMGALIGDRAGRKVNYEKPKFFS
jgi:hypothetical protein